MKRNTLYITASFAVLVSVAALGISAAVDSPRTLMSKSDYQDGRKSIEATTRAALARCREREAGAKDICKAEVRAQETVTKADLQARYRGTVAAATEARVARVKANYEVAKARCGVHKGDERIECIRAARADQGKSFARLAAV